MKWKKILAAAVTMFSIYAPVAIAEVVTVNGTGRELVKMPQFRTQKETPLKKLSVRRFILKLRYRI